MSVATMLAWLAAIPPSWLAALAVACALALMASGMWLAAWWRDTQRDLRAEYARDGESRAEVLLAAAGYRVVARQLRGEWVLSIDGSPVVVSVRADLEVERAGRRWIVEVKTGARAPDPTHPATRRQLLEYSLAFDVPEILLVDVDAGAVHTVRFDTAWAAAWRAAG